MSEFVRSRLFLIAGISILLIWLLDPLVDVFLLGEGTVYGQLVEPSTKELYFRSFLSLLIFLGTVLLRLVFMRYGQQHAELREQREMIQRVIDSEPECVKTVAADGALLDMNLAGLDIIEADSIEQVRHACVYDLIAEEDRAAYIAFNEQVFCGKSGIMEYDVIGLKGGRKRVETHAVPMLDEDGRVTAHLAVTRDITELLRSQKELTQFSVAVEQCASVVMITDDQARITYVNPRFTHVTGFSADEALGNTPRMLRSGKHPEEFYGQLWERVTTGGEWRGKMQNRRKSGELYWAMMVISPLKDETGKITQYLCTQEDVTSSHLLTEQLDHQARHCMLTGLINRYEFEQRLAQLLRKARQDNIQHAVFFLDIDQFKVVNDSCGHMAGDQLLRQIGALIQSRVRQGDVVSRLGGDEFAVLLEHCTALDAARIAEDLRSAVEESVFGWGENIFRVTVSIGVVNIDGQSPETAELMTFADTSCYLAKELGRNRIYLHQNNATSQRRQDEAMWVGRIHEGINGNRFCLYVQEIAGLQDQQTCHYEVLIRYRDEKGAIVPPGAFLPPAERFGLSPKLDRWVIRQVCEFLAGNSDRNLKLSINLSGLSIADDELLQYVRKTLASYGVDPKKLGFEITETAAISNLANAVQFIEAMNDIGCSFSLDDFGSGLSSFGYLKTLPVDYVKIDGIFVKDILDDQVDLAMVRSINDIGHLMGKRTIAEFVENQAIADLLKQVGVDYAQGYGISKPRPIETLATDPERLAASVEDVSSVY
ncbi:EAL domain-containing protein [Pontibacterium granulatum]|uniref:putative bifunctional diguanylate cyclase/phosphodiesterase n=1 Tax=Pontibacterium granulatum TaxID=2036029 RepID=UPI00249B082D|nr:GGDEF and EAL domain-containing protein [Pontibacterium granulatum]MDI3323745.1 EAL domain-containing protein [Pontibacterium granulatum]